MYIVLPILNTMIFYQAILIRENGIKKTLNKVIQCIYIYLHIALACFIIKKPRCNIAVIIVEMDKIITDYENLSAQQTVKRFHCLPRL